MKFSASYTNLETVSPAIDIDPSHINAGQSQPTLFRDDRYSGGTIITIAGPKYSAGLSKRYVTPPPGLLSAMSFYKFSYDILLSETASLYSQCNENDFRLVDVAGNLYIGDAQKNNFSSGMWQIGDGKGGWIDTGFKPGLFSAKNWTTVTVTYGVDLSAKTLTFLDINDGGQTFTFPSSIAVIKAAQNSGWQANLLGFQNQETMNALGGTYTRSTRNIAIQMQ